MRCKCKYFFVISIIGFFIIDNTYAQKIVYSIPEAQGKAKFNFSLTKDSILLLNTPVGVYYFNGLEWKSLAPEIIGNMSSNVIKAVVEDKKGEIWMGYSNNCLQKISSNGKIMDFKSQGGKEEYLIKGTINNFYPRGDSVIVASDYGLFIMSQDMKLLSKESFVEHFPNVIHSFATSDIIRCTYPIKGQPNSIWIGGTMGLATLDLETKKWRHFPMPSKLLEKALMPKFTPKDYNNLMVTDIIEHGEKVYCATWGGGIMAFNKILNVWEQYAFQDFDELVPLDDNIAYRLELVNDSILVSTTQAFKSPVVLNINTKQFIPFKDYFHIEPAYDYSEAIQKIGNELWIGYFNSVECYSLYTNNNNTQSDGKGFVSMITNNDSILYVSKFFSNEGNINSLTVRDGELKIFFGKTPGHPIEYYYRLIGNDESVKEGDTAIYVQLGGGDYILEYAQSVKGPWEIIRIGKDKKWYENHWILISLFLSALLVIILLGLVVQSRINNKKRRDLILQNTIMELERKAFQSQMNPHFIFNSLVSIKSYIADNEAKKATNYINDFANLVRMILNYSNEKSISLKSELEVVELYLSLERERFGNKFTYEIIDNSGMDLNKINIPPLLFQPFVENAVWHGIMHHQKKGKIQIVVEVESDFLLVHILDDGIGFSNSSKFKSKNKFNKKSYGIPLSEKRVLNFWNNKATVKIMDRVDESGTHVILKIPLI